MAASLSTVSGSTAGRYDRCQHPRQQHPFYAGAILLCAWPGCPQGTARAEIDVTVGRLSAESHPSVVPFERVTSPPAPKPNFRWRRR